MSAAQKKVLGFCSLLLALCCGIAYMGMREGARNRGDDEPSIWLLVGLVFFIVTGIRGLRAKEPDFTTMSDIDVIWRSLKQTRTVSFIVLVCCWGLAFLMIGFAFFGWDDTFRRNLVNVSAMGCFFSLTFLIGWMCVLRIYQTIGPPAHQLIHRITQRPNDISDVRHTVITSENMPASAHGSVVVTFVDGTSFNFQVAPSQAERIVQIIQERRTVL